ncbi:MAG: hypothetical protein FK732_04755 [Asgard group archaeon]|nr:hypothetical protein [Asgard group archaeon]
MFKRTQKKTQDSPRIIIFTSSKIKAILSESSEQPQAPLTNKQADALKQYLEVISKELEMRSKYHIELFTSKKREKQLNETKKVVFSLRETDQTSGDALDFLKEKMDILIQEKENLAFKFLSFRDQLQSDTVSDVGTLVQNLLSDIVFIDTDPWEEGLDYYRTRFLMQKEQEEDEELKDEFIPDQDRLDLLIHEKTIAELDLGEELVKEKIPVYLSKKHHQQLKGLVKDYNIFIEKIPGALLHEVLETPFDELKEKFKQQEMISFDIGKELYALKREQGILSLKTYEIIQTIRSRLLNITGSIASRNFMKNAFNELLSTARNEQLPINAKKTELIKITTRLLRIIGELKPGEN